MHRALPPAVLGLALAASPSLADEPPNQHLVSNAFVEADTRDFVPVPEAFHQVEIGFAVDAIGDLVVGQAGVAVLKPEVLQALHSLTSDYQFANDLPNLTINHMIGQSGITEALFLLKLEPVVAEANVMVGMAGLPVPIQPAKLCGTGTLPDPIYNDAQRFDIWDRNVEGRNHYPPDLGGEGCPYTHRPQQYEDFFGGLVAGTENFGPGSVTWETGNEPDSPDQFFGDAWEYLDKALIIGAGAAEAEDEATVFFGAYGSGTTFGTATEQAYEDFRSVVPAFTSEDLDSRGFSYHTFRDPCSTNEKTWTHLRNAPWPADTTERRSMSAFDTFGAVGMRWQETVENSSWLVYELAELFLHAQERDLESVYFWNLTDTFGGSQSGFFHEDGTPKPGFDYFDQVWQVVKGGYRAYKANGVIYLDGWDGMHLEATLSGPLPGGPKGTELYCKSQDMRGLPQAPMTDCMCDRFDSMDWVIYAPGRPLACDRGVPLPCLEEEYSTR